MTKEAIKAKIKQFVIMIIKFVEDLPNDKIVNTNENQISRSVTSITKHQKVN